MTVLAYYCSCGVALRVSPGLGFGSLVERLKAHHLGEGHTQVTARKAANTRRKAGTGCELGGLDKEQVLSVLKSDKFILILPE